MIWEVQVSNWIWDVYAVRLQLWFSGVVAIARKHIKWHKTNLLRPKESQSNCSVWTALDFDDLDMGYGHTLSHTYGKHWNISSTYHLRIQLRTLSTSIFYDFTLMSPTCVRAKGSPGRPNIKQYIHYDHTGNYRYHDRLDYDVVNVFVLCGLSARVNNRVFS